MKQLLIAEKPDVARNNYLPLLERVSGEKFTSKQGYYESSSYYLTWFIGHLLEGLMPDEYDEKYKQWQIDDLPIIPEKFLEKVKSDRVQQAQTIVKLAQNSRCIICGTDADREGQRIFSSLMEYYNINVPTKRLWPSSYADDDLLKLWGKMKDMREWDGWTNAAIMRNETDWLIGMNATRAYSIIAKAKLPIGRVMSATLALVVERDAQVENYKESFYYTINGYWENIKFTYCENKEKKFENENYCRNKLLEIKDKNFEIKDKKKENKKENPPRPYSQPDLQIEADKRFGFTAIKTLDISQSLYEKKLITYPRTDSTNLPKSDYAKYVNLINTVATNEEKHYLMLSEEMPDFIINKEEPHSAIVITSHRPTNGVLTPDEAKIYNLIRDRFVLSFMKPALYIQYDFKIEDEKGNVLTARIRQDTFAGFKAFTKKDDANEKEDDNEEQKMTIDETKLPSVSKLLNANIEKIKRAKPKYFTNGTLLTAMKNCGRKLEREEDRKIMAEKEHPGIGTPATQAATIKQLFDYEYVRSIKNKIISTPKGRKLIEVLAPDLKTPALTANWELKLKKIQELEMNVPSYRQELKEYIAKIIEDAKKLQGKVDFRIGEETEYACPRCRKTLQKFQWGYGCTDKECGFRLGFTIAGKKITEKQIESLLTTGETPVINGFKGKKGDFSAKLVLNGNKEGKKEVTFEFEVIPCPKCKKGNIHFFEWGVACSEKCGLIISREIAHKKLSDSALKMLVLQGKTQTINDFKNKAGKVFRAKIILDKSFKTIFTFE